MLSNPLTPPERRAAVRLVAEHDQVLADRLDAELAGDGDPFVEALQGALTRQTESVTSGLAEVRGEIRSMRNWTVGLIAVAMVLQTLLVGGSVYFKGFGLSLSTTAAAATPSSAGLELVDEDLGAAGPSPEPADPQL